ncbi:uncharacterized protein EI90DRAFT_3021412 [Cantharellus anzutake]|uniref:uncharacterized protein n=1 Tax=Cantharellus anzutake TaxID=1750568 RepID=UPI0019070EBA|nr:uncharacterized protein EI90DRAFT_3021412 [Cantharellus anzutake]KAF8316982.1 hypothetical protein EI90DRAFT_3021412 [Cantharellus anzutake]
MAGDIRNEFEVLELKGTNTKHLLWHIGAQGCHGGLIGYLWKVDRDISTLGIVCTVLEFPSCPYRTPISHLFSNIEGERRRVWDSLSLYHKEGYQAEQNVEYWQIEFLTLFKERTRRPAMREWALKTGGIIWSFKPPHSKTTQSSLVPNVAVTSA